MNARREAGWGLLIGILVAWLVAGFVGALLGGALTGSADDEYAAPAVLLGHVGLPALLGLGVGAVAASALRWWPEVLHEPLRMRAWGWVFPIVMVLAGAAFADWSRLSAAGPALLAALVLTVLAIAASEELMFRGIVLRAMRDRYHEGVAALVTTVVFAVMHVIVGGGLGNLLQGLSTLLGGYLYYVTRRVSGGLLAPIVVHALWDLLAFSVIVGPGEDSDKKVLETLLVVLVLGVAALALWRPLNRAAPSAAAEPVGDGST